ncbi:MAG: DUF2085 domain-containing protein [Anaerolineae bacterium]|nr:DUF2085 domain-containing protein [Anaerolineae bacterium]
MHAPEQPTMPLFSRRTHLIVASLAVSVFALWLLGTPDGLLGKAAAVGYAICHQIAERTFPIDLETNLLMPLCARCTGIYLGVLLSFLLLTARRRLRSYRFPPVPIIITLISFVGILGVDGVNSYLTFFPGYQPIYPPSNPLRLLTGLLTGIAATHLIVPFFNSTLWMQPQPTRSLDGWRDLLATCGMAGIVALLVLSERPLIRWTLSILSSLSVVGLLSAIGAALFVSVLRRERQARTWRDLIVPLLAGFTLAMLQLGAITIVRFSLTGTWSGFVIN